MSARIIGTIPRGHRCDLPDDPEWGTVAICRTCERVFVADPIPWEREWRRLRPWPFDRKVRALLIRATRGGES